MRKSTVDLSKSAARLSVEEIAAAYRDGSLTPTQVVEDCLAIIADVDLKIRAWQEVYADDAREAAAACTEALEKCIANGGDAAAIQSPLYGVPVALKDVIDVEGKVTTAGSAARLSEVATGTAILVQNIQRLGGIILGKVKTTEFAGSAYGINSHPECISPINPYSADVPLICGGSSNGSGAALAARMVPLAVGSDTGGSIRRPAAFCGVVGLKTTKGMISTEGLVPLSHSFDTAGPLARTCYDCALLCSAMMDPDDRVVFEKAVYPAMKDGIIRGLRFACIGEKCRKLVTDAKQLAAFDASLDVLRKLGATIVEKDLDLAAPWAGGASGFSPQQSAEMYYHLCKYVDDPSARVADEVRASFLRGKDVTLFEYFEIQKGLPAAIKTWLEMMADCDAWLSPTTQMLAIPFDDAKTEAAMTAIMVQGFTRWVNYLGLCALSVPTGPVVGTDGLPTSLQIVCKPHQEVMAFRIGSAYEKARGELALPPLFT